MKAKYDKVADAVFIELKSAGSKVVEKTVCLSEDIIVDLDKNKKLVGIEILNASKNLGKKELLTVKAVC